MWIDELTLQNFRNYKSITTHFSRNLNVFLGENAQGKTNLLEAIYFLALTRSHRTRHDKELIHFDQQDLKITGNIVKQNGKIPLEVLLSKNGRTTKVNHLKQGKLSDYIGHLTVVLFAPEDLQLIKGVPQLRRKFMDIDLGQIKPIYLSDLTNYNHVLKQRNSYLKTTQSIDNNFLDVLDEQLVEFGARVISHRLDFITSIENYAKDHQLSLSHHKENLTMVYESSFQITPEENLKNLFLNNLVKQRQRDVIKKNTSIGPHRDDLSFYLNDINANFGSQGQQRSLILSLKMAEIDLIRQADRKSVV